MTVTAPAAPARAATEQRPVPFTRLALVELRKQVDTRAGAWLLGVVVAVNVALAGLMLATSDPEYLTWSELTGATSAGQLLLVPLIGILAATSEWSQRTALTTFTLEPRRLRVNLAKLTSAVGLGLLTLVVTLAASAVLNVAGMVARDGDGSWALDADLLGGMTLMLVILIVQGVAFGLAFLSTPVAIVAYLALPTVWTVVTVLVDALREPAQWLNLDAAMAPLVGGQMTPTDWAHLGVSALVWLGVPLAVGLWRTTRRDVV